MNNIISAKIYYIFRICIIIIIILVINLLSVSNIYYKHNRRKYLFECIKRYNNNSANS